MSGKLNISFQGSRVLLVVFVRAKLEWVHEYGDGDHLVLFAGTAHQISMAVVESTHGRHIAQRRIRVLNRSTIFGGRGPRLCIQLLLRSNQRLSNSGAKLCNGLHYQGFRYLSHDENSLSEGRGRWYP